MNENDQLNRVLEKIQEIVKKTANGDYIYRGEPKCYPKVSSGLYREYSKIETKNFGIEDAQKEFLEDAKDYTPQTDDFEILTELQHYGGATNLIDFTTDYLIALFFACDHHLDKDGRIILLPNTNPHIVKPRNPLNRVIAQKSRFIRPPKGFIEPRCVIDIPQDLKKPILNHLRKRHGISKNTIYNDLHGFIRYQKAHKNAYTELFLGINEDKKEKAIEHYSKAIRLNSQNVRAYYNRGNAYRRQGRDNLAIKDYKKAIELNPDYVRAYYNRGNAYRRQGEDDLAIDDYSQAIQLNPDYIQAYNNRGNAYRRQGRFDLAIKDYKKAIELNSDYALAYYGRGICRLLLEKWQKAISDLEVAKNLQINIITEFCANYQSVTNFEQQYNVELPENIKAMLT